MNSERDTEVGTFAMAGEKAVEICNQRAAEVSALEIPNAMGKIQVALLTGGGDRPYAYGLATELIKKGIALDLIGSDDLDFSELRGLPGVQFLNLRGDQNPEASFKKKTLRILAYYLKLISYAFHAKPRIFHILWNNKFEIFDRTLLMLYYRLLRRRVVLTIHNVNIRKRDSKDSLLNRLSLRIQYHLADHLFVHSEKMQAELKQEFGVSTADVTVIPFGINNAVPNTNLRPDEARQRLGIAQNEKVILFFGNIAPYKGLEYLVTAFQQFLPEKSGYRLVIAGRRKGFTEYWSKIQQAINPDTQKGSILLRPDYVPDEETEIYFKAADVLVLPYKYIYQSGVLFLSYSFGLPVLAADVGPLREEIVEGNTGYVFKPEDPADLGRAINDYFASDLYLNLQTKRREIQDFAAARHSWDVVGEKTRNIYSALLGLHPSQDDRVEKLRTASEA